MHIEVTDLGGLRLRGVSVPIVFENDIGERISVCQRDGVFEVCVLDEMVRGYPRELVRVVGKECPTANTTGSEAAKPISPLDSLTPDHRSEWDALVRGSLKGDVYFIPAMCSTILAIDSVLRRTHPVKPDIGKCVLCPKFWTHSCSGQPCEESGEAPAAKSVSPEDVRVFFGEVPTCSATGHGAAGYTVE